jgi:crotonobetainyl-CoA:carnitine CoA-transferase CaiB-like acyl-CoA transferase
MSNNQLPTVGAGPLAGILVLDHTTALAGPYCTQLLGDLGADVIKIERPGEGDQARGWGPPFVGGESAYFLGTNRNKRGMTLDLSQPAGREVLRRLLERADVLVHNVPRESSRQKLGLDEATCRAINRRLIWASITGFGNTGPYAERGGYDAMIQGMGGTMYLTGEPDSGPARFPTAIADITTGMYTALAILSALLAREHTGEGQAIDTALFDSQVTWLANIASNYLASGEPAKKLGNAHPNIVPYEPFPTADGWIIVAAGNESLWGRLVELLEWPELGDDPRFATNADRLVHRDELIPLLAKRFRQRPAREWLDRLEKARIPAGPINTPEETLQDEHLLARGMIVELQHPAAGLVRSLGNPMKLSGTPVTYRRPAPMLGEHTEEILAELGYGAREIEHLRDEGVI